MMPTGSLPSATISQVHVLLDHEVRVMGRRRAAGPW
jgi:hypothetical protein